MCSNLSWGRNVMHLITGISWIIITCTEYLIAIILCSYIIALLTFFFVAQCKRLSVNHSHIKSCFTNSAPGLDTKLTPDDAAEILEELMPAQNQSFVLGLKLKLPQHEVEAIHLKYSHPSDRLLYVIIAFLNHVKPRPTWSVIVEALRSPAVNLPALASRIEAAHFPDEMATRKFSVELFCISYTDHFPTLYSPSKCYKIFWLGVYISPKAI